MLTLIQMIDHALSQAQLDSSFRQDARTWYNVIVNRLTANYDYPRYRTSADINFVAGQKSYDLPTDFNRADECYQINVNGDQGAMIPLMDSYMFQQMNGGNISGPASVGYIDINDNKILLNTKAGGNTGTNGLRLYYFKTPTQVNLFGADDASIPDFPDQDSMIEELKAMAYEFRNDERYPQKKAEANKAKDNYQRNQYNDDSYSVTPLNAVTFRGNNRRSRSRGFRGN